MCLVHYCNYLLSVTSTEMFRAHLCSMVRYFCQLSIIRYLLSFLICFRYLKCSALVTLKWQLKMINSLSPFLPSFFTSFLDFKNLLDNYSSQPGCFFPTLLSFFPLPEIATVLPLLRRESSWVILWSLFCLYCFFSLPPTWVRWLATATGWKEEKWKF